MSNIIMRSIGEAGSRDEEIRGTLDNCMNKYPELSVCMPEVWRAFELMRDSFREGCKLLVCGNGGSASDSDHIVGELMKGFMHKRPLPEEEKAELIKLFPESGELLGNQLQGALPAISLTTHSALITAFANDVNADLIFAQQVYGYGLPGDTLLALSTSGNSSNVLHAVRTAKLKGMRTIGLTGINGGKLKEFCDVTICVPSASTPDIQERHLPIYHALCIMLEKEFFG